MEVEIPWDCYLGPVQGSSHGGSAVIKECWPVDWTGCPDESAKSHCAAVAKAHVLRCVVLRELANPKSNEEDWEERVDIGRSCLAWCGGSVWEFNRLLPKSCYNNFYFGTGTKFSKYAKEIDVPELTEEALELPSDHIWARFPSVGSEVPFLFRLPIDAGLPVEVSTEAGANPCIRRELPDLDLQEQCLRLGPLEDAAAREPRVRTPE